MLLGCFDRVRRTESAYVTAECHGVINLALSGQTSERTDENTA